MPEGPEVWWLARAIEQATHGQTRVASVGKRLRWTDVGLVQSFGLRGRVHLAPDGTLCAAQPSSWATGTVVRWSDDDDLPGLDWMTADPDALREVVRRRWCGAKAQLGSLLLDQHTIAGIGVAWGAEILHEAGGLRPERKAIDQHTRLLPNAVVAVRDRARQLYAAHVDGATADDVNAWFDNCYEWRRPSMRVYERGNTVRAHNRRWFVSAPEREANEDADDDA